MNERIERAKQWVKYNRNELITIGLLSGAALVGLKLKNRGSKKEDVLEVKDEGKFIFNDRFLYQLEDQEEVWMVITADINSKGEPTNLNEIARQLVAGEFREE